MQVRNILAVITCLFIWQVAMGQLQDFVVVLEPSCGNPSCVIDKDGKQLFQIDTTERFIVESKPYKGKSLIFEYTFFYDKDRGPLIVLSNEAYELRDFQGNKIARLTKYGSIHSAWNGRIKAVLKKTDAKQPSRYVYLDEAGAERFNGEQFLYATNFAEDLAIVMTESNEWKVVSKEDESLGIIDESEVGVIKLAKPFSDGLALLVTDQGHVYVNERGELQFKLSEKIPNAQYPASGFLYGVAYVDDGDDYVFFDKNGEIVKRFENIMKPMGRNSDYVLFYTRDAKRLLVSRKDLVELEITKLPHENTTIDKVFGHYARVMYTDMNTGKRHYSLVDLRKNEVAFSSNRNVLGVRDGKFYAASKKYQNDLYFIQKINGAYLYKNGCK